MADQMKNPQEVAQRTHHLENNPCPQVVEAKTLLVDNLCPQVAVLAVAKTHPVDSPSLLVAVVAKTPPVDSPSHRAAALKKTLLLAKSSQVKKNRYSLRKKTQRRSQLTQHQQILRCP